MTKPTFEVCFSAVPPTKPGLWLVRRNSYIAVMDVQASDIDRNGRDPSWLEGDWGALLHEVAHDVVPLQAKMVKAYIDGRIRSPDSLPDAVETLQTVREHLFGARYTAEV